jgi:hypothetical protein
MPTHLSDVHANRVRRTLAIKPDNEVKGNQIPVFKLSLPVIEYIRINVIIGVAEENNTAGVRPIALSREADTVALREVIALTPIGKLLAEVE